MKRHSNSLRGSSGGGGDRGQGGGRGFGQSQGDGRGMGRGGGRGMGRGRGGSRGMRQGVGRGMGLEASPSPVESPHFQPSTEHPGPGGLGLESPSREIEMLKAQADTMMAQLQTINARISILQEGKAPAPTDVANVDGPGKTWNATRGGGTAAIVDEKECVSCGVCADVCPEEAITIRDIAEIDPRKCTGCGSCVDECPNRAIFLVKLEKALS